MAVRLAEAYSQLSDLAQATTMLEELLDAIPSDADASAICVKLEAYYHYVVSSRGAGQFPTRAHRSI